MKFNLILYYFQIMYFYGYKFFPQTRVIEILSQQLIIQWRNLRAQFRLFLLGKSGIIIINLFLSKKILLKLLLHDFYSVDFS